MHCLTGNAPCTHKNTCFIPYEPALQMLYYYHADLKLRFQRQHSAASMVTNSIILLLVLSISQCMSMLNKRDVYIQPSEGEHCPGTYCYNITTFGKMADSFSNSFGLVVHFLEGTHLLDLQELVVFTNLTNAVFEGDGRIVPGQCFHELLHLRQLSACSQSIRACTVWVLRPVVCSGVAQGLLYRHDPWMSIFTSWMKHWSIWMTAMEQNRSFLMWHGAYAG